MEDLTRAIGEKYDDSLRNDEYETYEEPAVDFESVNKRLWEQKEREGRGTYEEFLAKKASTLEIKDETMAPAAAAPSKKSSKSSKAK